jgi:hypothetical protein
MDHPELPNRQRDNADDERLENRLRQDVTDAHAYWKANEFDPATYIRTLRALNEFLHGVSPETNASSKARSASSAANGTGDA